TYLAATGGRVVRGKRVAQEVRTAPAAGLCALQSNFFQSLVGCDDSFIKISENHRGNGCCRTLVSPRVSDVEAHAQRHHAEDPDHLRLDLVPQGVVVLMDEADDEQEVVLLRRR